MKVEIEQKQRNLLDLFTRETRNFLGMVKTRTRGRREAKHVLAGSFDWYTSWNFLLNLFYFLLN